MGTERAASPDAAPSALPIGRADGPEAVIAASRISTRLWRLYVYFWLVCLVFPILALTQTTLTPLQLLIAIAGLMIFVASYFWVMWPHMLKRTLPARASARAALLLAMLTALVLMLSLVYGSAFLWLFVGVSAIAGVTLSARRAFEVVVVLTLLTLGMGVSMGGGIAQTDWLHLIPLVLLVRGLGVDMIGLALLANALRDLHAARRELARMAVMEERLRLARDLHDLLGHNLSLIALKSELAERLVVHDPARAAHEIEQVRHVARQTLREVREAVAGYRQPTIRTELDGARQLLEAAGIACTIEDTTAALPPATDAVLAWAVREGVTNVIRHSRARQCRIEVSCVGGSARAEVANDGERTQGQDALRSRRGSGLAGLAERVQAYGGQLEAGLPLADSTWSYRLSVEVPIHSGASAIEERQS